jgi:hypothetical protein
MCSSFDVYSLGHYPGSAEGYTEAKLNWRINVADVKSGKELKLVQKDGGPGSYSVMNTPSVWADILSKDLPHIFRDNEQVVDLAEQDCVEPKLPNRPLKPWKPDAIQSA